MTKEKFEELSKYIPLLLVLPIGIYFFFKGGDIDLETLMAYNPESLVAAALFLIGLYFLKGIAITFPVTVIKMAAGYFLPLGWAVVINLIGITISYTIPYSFARFYGSGIAKKLEKRKRIQSLLAIQNDHVFFASFFLRSIPFLAESYVSLYAGVEKLNYPKFITGSILGSITHVVTLTYVGANLTDFLNPIFFILIIANILQILLGFMRMKAIGGEVEEV